MALNVLVTGATGMLGSAVVTALSDRGVSFVGSGRHEAPSGFAGEWRQADPTTGEGLASALSGCSCVIHCATNASQTRGRPSNPHEDVIAIHRLIVEAGRQDLHIVYVGIAGIEDAAPHYAYYRVKLDCERMLAESGVPHTIVRATPFSPFVANILRQLTFGPLILAPRMTLQPVDVRFVSEELVRLSQERPVGRVSDLCGDPLEVNRLTETWFKGLQSRKLRIPVPGFGPLLGLTTLRVVEGRTGGESWANWVMAAGVQ